MNKAAAVTGLINVALGSALVVAVAATPAADAMGAPRASDYAAQAEATIATGLDQATAGRDCWTGNNGRIPSTVVVRGANWGDGLTHVRHMPLDDALAAAQAGTVWVLASCA